MKIYFAGSIRGGRQDAAKYLELIDFLGTLTEVLTEHVGASELGNQGENTLSDHEIHRRDLEWLESCDAVIAEVTNPSLGVGYEIGIAEKLGKPVLCLFDESQSDFRLSAMLSGNSKVQTFKYHSLGQAKQKITDFLDSF